MCAPFLRFQPYFQSTHPPRVRPVEYSTAVPFIRFQSTHPPRVRLKSDSRFHQVHAFNPRTHLGCDYLLSEVERLQTDFQSTHPPRVRRRLISVNCRSSTFQSTHPPRVRR
ncbi:hypothetical protein DJ90_5986 [Paenibacillus macerans]|uniref:Uncharacterized protein n=1 Tax=Paenibacillus macerans TaxID=44252 RepID=A0A090Y7H9_PAEMA|nr:hypothetical protein DJ90_5986 [Paenibacillus macerans]